MSIIFFPFTHITQQSFKILTTFFDRFQYLDIEAGTKHNHMVKDHENMVPMSLPQDIVTKADSLFSQYLEWVKIHKGNEDNLKALLRENPYFTADTHVTTIKSQLKDTGIVKGDTDPGRDVEKWLLFLKTAHFNDAQNEGIDRELGAVERAEQKLINTLRGIDETSLARDENLSERPEDPGAVMPGERVKAWGACARKVSGIEMGGPFVFVTTSQAIFEFIESNFDPCVNALDINEIKVHENGCENNISWQQAFLSQLENAARGKGFQNEVLPDIDDTCSMTGQIKMNLYSGNEINTCFNLSEEQVGVCLVKLK